MEWGKLFLKIANSHILWNCGKTVCSTLLFGEEVPWLMAVDKNLRLQCAFMENDNLHTCDPPVSLWELPLPLVFFESGPVCILLWHFAVKSLGLLLLPVLHSVCIFLTLLKKSTFCVTLKKYFSSACCSLVVATLKVSLQSPWMFFGCAYISFISHFAGAQKIGFFLLSEVSTHARTHIHTRHKTPPATWLATLWWQIGNS